MRNGPYELIVAPKEYPWKLYRGKYIYEHHYVYWKNMGCLLEVGEVIHHKNGNRRDNRFVNLELLDGIEHSRQHTSKRGVAVVFLICPICFSLFMRERRQTHIIKQKCLYAYCSRSCSGTAASVLKILDPTEIFLLQEKARKGN